MTNTDQASSQAAAEPEAQADFWMMNRNFGNYPLPRDPRVRLSWCRRRSAWWSAHIPELYERIELRLPPDAPERMRRVLTAFDMNVLSMLLMLACAQKRSTIVLSRSALVERIGHSASTRSLRHLDDSLEFLSLVRIHHDTWRVPGRKQPVSLRLPPPISSIRRFKGKLRIKMSRTWIDTARKFFKQVPLPLPDTAAVQNLALMLLTGVRNGEVTYRQDVAILAAKIGLSSVNRKELLPRIIEKAREWFKQHDGDLLFSTTRESERARFEIGGGRGEIIVFHVKDPKMPKSDDQIRASMKRRGKAGRDAKRREQEAVERSTPKVTRDRNGKVKRVRWK